MQRYKLIESYFQTSEFIDPQLKQKGILTTFINKNFIKTNDNELSLIHIIYSIIQPILDKYGLMLIFKGGNVMRLINNNVKQYFQPIPNHIIFDIFEPYLQQSDNDFTIFVNPNMKDYDQFMNELSFELYESLNKITSVILNDLGKYFDIFNLNDHKYLGLFKSLSDELNSKSMVNIGPTSNKIIDFENPLDTSSKIVVFDDTLIKKSFIFNSLNFTLNFMNFMNKTIRFILLRSKINFKVKNQNIAGELIDISIPHRDDYGISLLNTTLKFNTYLRDNIIKQHNYEYDFDYFIININYIIHDLHNILFNAFNYPWDNDKYTKRLARLIYFIFIDYLNSNPISISNYKKLIVDYQNFIYFIKLLHFNIPNNNHHLNTILMSLDKLMIKINDSNEYKFITLINNLMTYSEAIIRICQELIKYLSGLSKTSESILFELDIVK